MNRPIAFRIWHESTNKFYYMHLDEIIGLTRTISIPEKSILQQYTGLDDKNGKEIYEGDIVKFTSWDSPDTSLKSYLTDGLKIVRWSLTIGGDYPFAGFTFINYNCADLETGRIVDCMNIQYCEVIGNIFETPELLN